MDVLITSALEYKKMCNIKYLCILGKNGRQYEFILEFKPDNYYHLVGLGKLQDILTLRRNKERVFKDILAGKITYKQISESKFFDSEIMDRISYFCHIEQFIDCNEIIFRFDKKKVPGCRIEATYLLESLIDNHTILFFIDYKEGSKTEMFGRSFFPCTEKKYTVAQPKMHLLYKSKKNIITGDVSIQINKLDTQPTISF